MAASPYAINNSHQVPDSPHIFLEDNGYYWQLYRYFEAAKTDWSQELIDLYGGQDIDTYVQKRLRRELQEALKDFEWRGGSWKHQANWNETICEENEIWHDIDAKQMQELVNSLIDLIEFCLANKFKLRVDGD